MKLESSSATRFGWRATILRRPDLAGGVLRVRVLPGVGDVHRMLDSPAFTSSPKSFQTMSSSMRQRILREDRIAELLELLEDLVIDARIVVVRTAQQHDAEAIFRSPVVFNTSRAVPRMMSLSNLSIAFRPACTALKFSSSLSPRMSFQSSYIWRCRIFSSSRQVSVSFQLHALLREDVAFLGERRLYRCRGRRHGGAGAARLRTSGTSAASRSSGRR